MLGRRQRVVLFLLLALGHGLAIVAMVLGSRADESLAQARVTVLEFVSPEPVPSPPPPTKQAPVPVTSPAPKAGRRPRQVRAEPPATTGGAEAPPPGSLRLFEADGSLHLPDEVKDQLAEVESADREFPWKLAGVVEAGAFLERPPAIEYRETEFERYWRPHDKDLLTDLLEAAVEATTGEVRIPVPGSPGTSIVCKASLLAVAGACGVVKHDEGYRYPDPNVLTPEQDRQCDLLWEQIVQAGSQERWRRLRAIYDGTCRKPLASPSRMPPPAD
ncbi:hypothetical protein [Arenimonas fontis]|uniref:Uncharacterized protein n=1 Tax=Arenimonas fontis TaxID=2608255 RepID=A0A5B2ZEK7_9GAMM|nr:hypothetical protein [Arenimonas fontis]KAA2286013.1 hypothetical protein F0415_00460 [Arenimonas fontis]